MGVSFGKQALLEITDLWLPLHLFPVKLSLAHTDAPTGWQENGICVHIYILQF